MSRPGAPDQRQLPPQPDLLDAPVPDASEEPTPLFDQVSARIPLQTRGR